MIKDKIKVSENYKSAAKKANTSIVFFVIVYIILVVIAVALTILCGYAGVIMVKGVKFFYGQIAGLGLMLVGALVLFFLLKFIFSVNKVDRSNLLKITRAEEPELFKMIDEIVREVGTEFPKNVFLSSGVNACVFYDSSFWSMFFPVKKNLEIGMGLVNASRTDELKAILSHEFGHFSQKTLRTGSYVYTVNHIIFNMLYENNSYGKMIQKLTSINYVITFFVMLSVKIIMAVQWILKIMYGFVNKNYLALSREMEFQADEIAANVTGYLPLKTNFLRLELADQAFNNVLGFYDEKIANNILSENIYPDHKFVMELMAGDRNIPVVDGIPEVSREEYTRFKKSKLIIKNQWATHPETIDRIARLEALNIPSKNNNLLPAWNLFADPDKTQRALTKNLFEPVKFSGETKPLSLDEFKAEISEDYKKNTFPKIFNGYYDFKNPEIVKPEELTTNSDDNLNNLFSAQNVALIHEFITMESDLENIKNIANKTIKVKSFDYAGKKYSSRKCNDLISELEIKLSEMKKAVKEIDVRIYSFFIKTEQQKPGERKLEKLYNDFYRISTTYEEKIGLCNKMLERLQFVNDEREIDWIKKQFKEIAGMELQLKSYIREIIETDILEDDITLEISTNFKAYLSKDLEYFGSSSYYNDNLNILFKSIYDYAPLLNRSLFLHKKQLVDYQAFLSNR